MKGSPTASRTSSPAASASASRLPARWRSVLKFLLLDEPLAALDKKLREETQFELMELQSRLGTTFVIVTHDQEEAMTVAHRMAVMNRGQIAQVGTPAQIYEQPNSRWVAEFVGDVNLIEGRLAASADGVVLEDAQGRRFQAGASAHGAARRAGCVLPYDRRNSGSRSRRRPMPSTRYPGASSISAISATFPSTRSGSTTARR